MSGSFPSPAFNIATIFSQPVATTDAANKAYVDATTGGSGGPFLPLAGGTVSGTGFFNGGGGRSGNWAESGTFTGGTYNAGSIIGTWTGAPTFSGATTVGTNSAAASAILNGPDGSTRTLQYNNTGLSRWRWQCDGATSTGNAGDTLRLFGFSDAGGSLGEVMRFTRATGSIVWNNGLSYTSAVYQFHGSTTAVTVDGTLNQAGTHTYTSGTAPGTGGLSPLGISQSLTFTGTLDTGSGNPNLNSIITTDTLVASRALPFTAQWNMSHSYNTGASGDRAQIGLTFAKNAASLDGLATGPFNLIAFMHCDVGESTNPGAPLSRASSVNFDTRIGGTGFAWQTLNCQENDIRVFAGNTVVSKSNISVHWGVSDAVHGSVEDAGIIFTNSPTIARNTGGGKTMLQFGGYGQALPWDPDLAGTSIMQVGANLTLNLPNGWIPTVTYGFDLWGLAFGTASFRASGITIDGAGQMPVLGPGAVTYSNNGLKLAVPNVRAVSATVAVGGSGYHVGDIILDSMGTLWTVATLTGNAVATVTLKHTNYASAAPVNPVATQFGSGTGCTLNLTTATTGELNLSDTGQKLGFFGAAAVVKPTVTGSKGANAALASLLTALANFGLLTDSST